MLFSTQFFLLLQLFLCHLTVAQKWLFRHSSIAEVGRACGSVQDHSNRFQGLSCGNNAICKYDICKCLANFEPDQSELNCRRIQCSADLECDRSSHCSLGKCVCNDHHFESSVHDGKCLKNHIGGRCTATIDCGQNATCTANQCTCKESFRESANGIDCRHTNLMETCQSSQQTCGENAYCGHRETNKELVCGCKFNFEPASSDHCKRIACDTNRQCAENSKCNTTTGCHCSHGFRTSPINGTCFKVPLNDECEPTNDECGINAECIEHRCQCKQHFYPVATSHVDCRKAAIFEACTQDFASCGQNARCRDETNHCHCLPGHTPHTNTIDCVPVLNGHFVHCVNSTHCGRYSYCFNGHCICDYGHVRSDNQFDCQLHHSTVVINPVPGSQYKLNHLHIDICLILAIFAILFGVIYTVRKYEHAIHQMLSGLVRRIRVRLRGLWVPQRSPSLPSLSLTLQTETSFTNHPSQDECQQSQNEVLSVSSAAKSQEPSL